MILRVLSWCLATARYAGPDRREALELLKKLPEEEATLGKGFDLGYRRGYADAAQYLSEWIEEEEGE